MKTGLILIFFFYCSSAFSQSVLDSLSSSIKQENTSKKVFSISVGISDYKYVSDLRYADKDALIFKKYVQENSFWNQNLFSSALTNEYATAGNITAEFDKVLNYSNEGDEVLFYFAGHGDIERDSSLNRSFSYLLTYDTPQNTYPVGASISSDEINDIARKLFKKGVKLYLVIDACHSGKLAGGMRGVGETEEAFEGRVEKEVRILSSKRDQLSKESAEFGGGRGIFSYFLVKGLLGAGKTDNYREITLDELKDYVYASVRDNTDPAQRPQFRGADMNDLVISYRADNLLTAYEDFSPQELDRLSEQYRMKGLESYEGCEYLSEQFDSELRLGNSFEKLHKLYSELTHCSGNSVQTRAAYASKLMNSIYETATFSLSGEKLVDSESINEAITQIDLLLSLYQGEEFLKRDALINTRLYLKTMNYTVYNYKNLRNNEGFNAELEIKKSELLKAINNSKNATHLSYALASVYSRLGDIDSSIYYLSETVNESPKWLLANYNLGRKLMQKGDFENAQYSFERILELDSTYKSYECFGCFFEELYNLLYLSDPNNAIESLEAYLKNQIVSKSETNQLYFQLYLNSGRNKWYEAFKKNVGNSFSDRLMLLYFDVVKLKGTLTDKSVINFIHFMNNKISQNKIYDLLNETSDPESVSENKIFRKYFRTQDCVYNYDYETYAYFRLKTLYILLSENRIVKSDISNHLEFIYSYSTLYFEKSKENWGLFFRNMISNPQFDFSYKWKEIRKEHPEYEDKELFLKVFESKDNSFSSHYIHYFTDDFYTEVGKIMME